MPLSFRLAQAFGVTDPDAQHPLFGHAHIRADGHYGTVVAIEKLAVSGDFW